MRLRKSFTDPEDFQILPIGPAATTGPVGAPVGDPPAGSRLTASTVPSVNRLFYSCVKTKRAGGLRGNTPRDTGGLVPMMNQSSKSRFASISPEIVLILTIPGPAS